HVGEQLHRVDHRVHIHGVTGGGREFFGFGGDRVAILLAQDFLRKEVLLEAFNRVAALPGIHFVLAAVAGRVVRIGVSLDAIGKAFDDAGAASAARSLHGGRDDRVDGGGIVAVDVVAGHAVANGAVGDRPGAGL